MNNNKEPQIDAATEKDSETPTQYSGADLRDGDMSVNNYNPHQETENGEGRNMATNSSITNQVPVTTEIHDKEDQKTMPTSFSGRP